MNAREKKYQAADEADILVRPDSPIMVHLHAELKKRRKYVKNIAEVRRILDAELGDKTLTEELYKMRNE